MQKPTIKTVQTVWNKLHSMLADNTKQNCKQTNSSGIVEEVVPAYLLLDYFTDEVYESDEARRPDRVEITALEEWLAVACEQILSRYREMPWPDDRCWDMVARIVRVQLQQSVLWRIWHSVINFGKSFSAQTICCG